MRDYSGAVATEIIALLAIVIFISPRGKAVYYSLLGQTRVTNAGEASPFALPPPQGAAGAVTRFTPIGLVILALLGTRAAKGAFGLFLVWFLAALLTSMTLINYRQFLSFLVTTK